MSLQRALAIFKAMRVIIFAVCMIISVGCGTIFSLILVHEGNDIELVTRIVVIALTVIHFLGAVLLYLMIVVRFTVWLDAARVTIYLALVGGGAAAFISGRAKLPCASSGIGAICIQATISVVVGSLVLCGLLLCYLVGLSIIAHTIPGPLLARPPSDLLGGGLSTVNSRTSLMSNSEKSRHQTFSETGHYNLLLNRSSTRHHAPEPLHLTDRSENAALWPAFNYTVTTSPLTSSSSSSMFASEMIYTTPMIHHPYATSENSNAFESPPPSARSYSPRPSIISQAQDAPEVHYPAALALSPVSSVSSQRLRQGYDTRRPNLARFESAQSAPLLLGVPSQIPPHRLLPNHFQDAISRTSTPGTPDTTVSGPLTHIGSSKVSLSFGSRGFPLPPSYNTTPWSQYTNDYLKSYPFNPSSSETPPSTPLSLRPGVHSSPNKFSSSPSFVEPRRPISFRSIAASLHTMSMPSLPAPTAHLPPHPRLLQARFNSSLSQKEVDEAEIYLAIGAIPTPTSAKTFRLQVVPTDIPDWEHKV
ncbi:hypothetical protein D9757_002012 [Collybiopsis confluens]|uniref:Uncharacterized protein n=1 Tax=Collybiopsis confluens TaxID=2823264 RepID=A0A8H5MF60_9AGAR|nr:hypothetical protein D9757_002012 [Collybiopsis confluens]